MKKPFALKHLATLAAACLLSTLSMLAVEPSGTLPVMYINTEGGAPITSKEDYITATYYLDPNGVEGVKAFGSAEEPLPLQIRGRGNYTWVGFDKKPYRLKLDSKAALMGMPKSKHFGLLASADDNIGFLRNLVGYELSRRLGLAWTPGAAPVEVKLNGDYIGLYFLTELIRVDADRVNIVEQPDNITDPEAITGGWLVEIDNYDTDPHVAITEGNGAPIIFTYKTPEVLSAEQENFLRNQMTTIDKAIYTSDKTSTEWEQFVDIDELARYYIVQEILDDCESFHGSCYLYRDLGQNKKWMFGPVWDFGNAYHRGTSQFIWQEPAFNQTWIGEIYKFPRFQERVKEIWADFINTSYTPMTAYITNTAKTISQAAKNDAERWPQYGNADEMAAAAHFSSMFKSKVNWLGQQWGAMPPHDWSMYTIYFRGNTNGWGLTQPLTHKEDGTFSLNNIDITDIFKLATDDWKTIDLGSNGSPVELNKPYLLKDTGGNISVKDNAPLYNVNLTLNLNTKTLLISGSQGVDDITFDNNHSWQINALHIIADKHVDVYTATGVLVASGRGTFNLPGAGLYIVVENGSAYKIIAK